jgi:hypothetical protein
MGIDFLDSIRKPDKNLELSRKIIYTCLILVLGIALGIFSKWLDNMAIDDTIWWQHLLGVLDLRNVFSEIGVWILLAVSISVFSNSAVRAAINVFFFFVGMTISYHIYTIVFAGFNPMHYMMIWYGITMITPVFAFVCWYGKGEEITSVIIGACIIAIMMRYCFSFGMWYFSFRGILDTFIFIIGVVVLYVTPKQIVLSFIGGILFAYILKYVFMIWVF